MKIFSGVMAAVLCVAGGFASQTFAQDAKTWSGKEGNCLDWSTTWTMTKNEGDKYTGTIAMTHMGGPCRKQIPNWTFTGKAEAIIQGSAVSATSWQFEPGSKTARNVCRYNGTLNDDKVVGTVDCNDNIGGGGGPPWEMTIVK